MADDKKDPKALVASVLSGMTSPPAEEPSEEPITETMAPAEEPVTETMARPPEEPVTETMARPPEEPTATMVRPDPAREVTKTQVGVKGKRAASNLVDQALETTAPTPDAAAPPPAKKDAADLEAEASELIDVYFELEEPAERDALFDQLIPIETPVVTEFLRVMMHEDEDEYVRAAAA